MGDVKNLTDKEAAKKIKELAESADICMFTTALTVLPLTSRPMSTQKVDEEGNLWFLSARSSNKNANIITDKRVQLFYAGKSSSEYLSIFGEASIIIDKQKAKELWTPIAKAWFSDGVDDPELTIIKVKPLDSYYWDTKDNKLVALIKIATAAITGNGGDDGGIEGSIEV
ncbi:hypothetical protein BH11BAC6_BH11BAC6_15270 [soil metagenome]